MIDKELLAELIGERITQVTEGKRVVGLGSEIVITLGSGRKIKLYTTYESDFKIREKDGREAKSNRQLEVDKKRCNDIHDQYGKYFENLDFYKDYPVTSCRVYRPEPKKSYKAKGTKVPQPKYLVTDKAGAEDINLDGIKLATTNTWGNAEAKRLGLKEHWKENKKYIFVHDLNDQPLIPMDTLKLISRLRKEGEPMRTFFVNYDTVIPSPLENNFMVIEAYNKSDAVIRWAMTTGNFNSQLNVLSRTLFGRPINVFNDRELKRYQRRNQPWD